MVQKEGQSCRKHASRLQANIYSSCTNSNVRAMATSEKLSVHIVSSTRANSDSDVIFSLQVPNSLLLAWHCKVKDGTVPSYMHI